MKDILRKLWWVLFCLGFLFAIYIVWFEVYPLIADSFWRGFAIVPLVLYSLIGVALVVAIIQSEIINGEASK